LSFYPFFANIKPTIKWPKPALHGPGMVKNTSSTTKTAFRLVLVDDVYAGNCVVLEPQGSSSRREAFFVFKN